MKPMKKIMLLTSAVSAIVLLWLVPGINTAKQAQYTRKYEDVDKKVVASANDTTRQAYAVKIAPVYKTETIKQEMKLSKIKPEMFSRALQFEEVILEDSLLLEIDAEPKIVAIDTVQVTPADSLASIN
jgi:hypothetical protein